MSNQGHWTGLEVNPDKHFGFIYRITHNPSGRRYIGRKQIWMAKQGVKGCRSRVMDRQSPKWNDKCWRESNWKVYTGSSKNLLKHISEHDVSEYTFEIIEICTSRGELTYCEARAQWDARVLEATLPDGSYEYFNGQIGACKFRPKLHKEEA